MEIKQGNGPPVVQAPRDNQDLNAECVKSNQLINCHGGESYSTKLTFKNLVSGTTGATRDEGSARAKGATGDSRGKESIRDMEASGATGGGTNSREHIKWEVGQNGLKRLSKGPVSDISGNGLNNCEKGIKYLMNGPAEGLTEKPCSGLIEKTMDLDSRLKIMKVAYADLSLESNHASSVYANVVTLTDNNNNIKESNQRKTNSIIKTVKSEGDLRSKKSHSAPPNTSAPPSELCAVCPDISEADEAKEVIKESSCCLCPRKRNEQQDVANEHERKFPRSCSLERTRTPSIRPYLEKLQIPARAWSKDEPKPLNKNQENILPQEEKEEEEVLKTVERKENAFSFLYNRSFSSSSSSSSSVTVSSSPSSPPSHFSPPSPVCSPFPISFSPLSPLEEKRMDENTPMGREQTGESWVSQHLAHIMRDDSTNSQDSTESMDLEKWSSDSPRFEDVRSDRFMDVNQRKNPSRRESEKTRQKQLSKQLNSIKRRISDLEQELKEQQGYRPSHQDKLNNRHLKQLMAEQAKLKKELKSDKSEKQYGRRHVYTPTGPNSLVKIKEKLVEIMSMLDESRQTKGRPYEFEKMSQDQIYEEKMEMHDALREYEKEFGHPEDRAEKEVMKEVYERYRIVKRMARRSISARSKESVSDLITIPEDLEVDLTQLTPPQRIQFEVGHARSTRQNLEVSRHDMDLPSFSAAEVRSQEQKSGNQWHDMSRDQLQMEFKKIREEKKVARRAVKEYEEQFTRLTGRRVGKEDKEPIQETYKTYKLTKSQLKLITALLSKPESPKIREL